LQLSFQFHVILLAEAVWAERQANGVLRIGTNDHQFYDDRRTAAVTEQASVSLAVRPIGLLGRIDWTARLEGGWSGWHQVIREVARPII